MTLIAQLRSPGWRDPLIVTGSGLLAVAAIAFGAPTPVRAPLAMWFLLTGPGLAIVPLLKLDGFRWVGILAVSLVLDIAVAELMIYTGSWSLPLGMAMILVICAIGVGFQVRELLTEEADDDLKAIRGIGPTYELALKNAGITSYKQLADLTPSDIQRVAAAIGTHPARIERDNWVGAAAEQLKKTEAAGSPDSGAAS